MKMEKNLDFVGNRSHGDEKCCQRALAEFLTTSLRNAHVAAFLLGRFVLVKGFPAF